MAIKENFSQLIEENKLKFYKTAKIILKNDDDVYDALQEALLSMYQNYSNLNDKKLFSTWGTRIVINKCYDLLRKYKHNTVTIDRGTYNGVTENMVVVNNKGLIGKVVTVSFLTSEVRLLTSGDTINKISIIRIQSCVNVHSSPI